MPHGRPDWYNITPLVQIHASEDLNEAVARMSNVNTYDRRGNVIHTETFAHGLSGLDIRPTGNGAYCWYAGLSKSDGLSLKFYHTGEADSTTTLYHYEGLQVANSMGVEVAFYDYNIQGYIELQILQWREDGLDKGAIRYTFPTRQLHYFAQGGQYVLLQDGVALSPWLWTLIHMKFSVDFDNNTYLRCLFNNYAISMIDIPLSIGGGSYFPYYDVRVIVNSSGYSTAYLVLDHFIITINEI